MIETERLILRGWQESDRAPFAAMGQDPEVMTLRPELAFDHPGVPDSNPLQPHIVYVKDA